MIKPIRMHPSLCTVYQVGGSIEYNGIWDEPQLMWLAYYKENTIGTL